MKYTTVAQPDSSPARRAAAERCAHCRRELPTGEGTVIPYVGVVGPECRLKFAGLLALVAEVEMLQFNIDDQGSQRLAHSIWSTLYRVGFEVEKRVNLETRVLWLEVGSRRVQRSGQAMFKTWEQVRSEFEQRLKLAQAERDEQGEPALAFANPVTGRVQVPVRVGRGA